MGVNPYRIVGPPANEVPSYVSNPRGHVWKRNDKGHVDDYAYDDDHHTGPACTVCGYIFCTHCQDGPDEDCPGEEQMARDRLAWLETEFPKIIKENTRERDRLRKRFGKP